MKIPRWLVGCILAVIIGAPLGMTTWWWVMWPEHITREFLCLVSQGNLHGANSFTTSIPLFEPTDYGLVLLRTPNDPDGARVVLSDIPRYFREPDLQLQPRTLGEFLRGHRRFRSGAYDFTVERGAITCHRWFKFDQLQKPIRFSPPAQLTSPDSGRAITETRRKRVKE